VESQIAILVGLAAIVAGLTGLFGVIAFRLEGGEALAALALSTANIALGSILFLTGARRLWR
jgi:hypothetical protein